MKKVLLSAGLSLVLVLGLTACGGGGSESAPAASSGSGESTAAASSSSASEEAAAPEAAAPAGEVYDVGDFTVLVPDGWMVSPQQDMFAEKDENDEYPVNPAAIGLIKGGESEWDAFSKPTVYAYIYDGDAKSSAETAALFYDETSDISLSVNGTECIAFEAKSSTLSDENKFYVYNIVYIPINEERYFQVTVPIDMVDYEGVSVDDPDVQAILGSLTAK